MIRFLGILGLLACLAGCSSRDLKPIKVGILHSQTGALSASEIPVANATRLSLEELEQDGGLLGRRIEVISANGASNPETFAAEAERLIVDEGVDVIFGCWSSASRKAVLPVLEQHQHLLFYPIQYEGLEQSPHVVYTGAVPNQQMVPGIKWAFDHLGKKFFLVGSDYVYPRAANTMAKVQLEVLDAEVVGEQYLPLENAHIGPLLEEIQRTQPDVILNTINGDTSRAFFAGLRQAGITTPTLSLSTSEVEFAALGPDIPVGHYAVWSYFQSLDSPENQRFVQRYKARFGQESVTDDPMEAGYAGVKLWAQAVLKAGTSRPAEVSNEIGGESLNSPGGLISIDDTTRHSWKSVRVGQLAADGQFSILWSSQGPVRPRPFPFYRSRSDWEEYLHKLYLQWGERWESPQSL